MLTGPARAGERMEENESRISMFELRHLFRYFTLGSKKDQKSAASSLFTHPRDAAFTSNHPERE
jgi:hypothetical protein